MIDEPSSYLDVRQRLKAAQVRRGGSTALAAPGDAAPPLRPPPAPLRPMFCSSPPNPPILPADLTDHPRPPPQKKQVIRSLLDIKTFVIVVEHDLSGE